MRGRRYSIDGEQNIASPDDTLLGLVTGGTDNEPAIYMWSIGTDDTPADASIEWYWQRFSAAGTATAVTPQNLGPGTTASASTAGENHTAEPTYTANAILWRMALNQRASHTIVLDPDGALIVPITANNGLGLAPTHASSTVLCTATAHFQD